MDEQTTEEIVENQEEVTEQVDDSGGGDEGQVEESAELEASGDTDEEVQEEGEAEESGEESPADPSAYKFKAGVFNKETKAFEQKEFEIDKRFHSLMSDPESAKVIKDLHEKAYGLDTVKERLAEARQAHESLSSEVGQYKEGFQQLRNTYQSALKTGNLHKLDHFFDLLNIDKNVIFNYAIEKAKLQEMPPEQRQAIEARLESERAAEMSAGQSNEMVRQMQQQAHQMKMIQLEMTLNNPEIKQYADAFDSQVGQPGAFKKAVIQQGNLAWFQQQKDLSPQEAAQEVIRGLGLKPQAAKNPVVTQQGQKRVVAPTIPNIQSRSSGSPVTKKKFKSIDDLKKYTTEKYGS